MFEASTALAAQRSKMPLIIWCSYRCFTRAGFIMILLLESTTGRRHNRFMIEKPNRDVTRGVRTSTLTLGCALLVASGSVLSEFSVAVAENISADPPTSPSLRRRVPLSAVTINDTFWAPKLKLLRERTVPFSWNYMGWELRALEKANGRTVQGDLNGTWGEANLHKFLETASHSLALAPDPALERRLDGVIGLLAGAQQQQRRAEPTERPVPDTARLHRFLAIALAANVVVAAILALIAVILLVSAG